MMFPKPRPAVFDKRDQQRERENIQRAVAASVSARDGHVCRCCGRRDGLHHHHLTYRSRGGMNSTENECLLCKFCHALVHARQLWILGVNADRHLQFEIDERAVVDIFGNKELPRHVRMVPAAQASRR